MPKVNTVSFCCDGGIDIDTKYFVDQNVMNVFVSIEYEIILIETGVNQQRDGCDKDPFYQLQNIYMDN